MAADGVRRVRLDRALVDRGLARSRGQARELIEAGAVQVDGVATRRVAGLVTPEQSLRLQPHAALPRPNTAEPADPGDSFHEVGRGYRKLAHALHTWPEFASAVAGAHCLDAGASTGGFTQALLQWGAAQVDAVDVGHAQLDARLRADPRVRERSGTNVRNLGAADAAAYDVVVADLSFISLSVVLGPLRQVCRPVGQAIFLVKPQFEVGRERLPRSGVVRSPQDRAGAVHQVVDQAQATGWGLAGLAASPLPGGSGNREFLVWLCDPASTRLSRDAVRSAVWAVVVGDKPVREP